MYIYNIYIGFFSIAFSPSTSRTCSTGRLNHSGGCIEIKNYNCDHNFVTTSQALWVQCRQAAWLSLKPGTKG